MNKTKPEVTIEKSSPDRTVTRYDRTVTRYKTYVTTYKDLIEKIPVANGDKDKDRTTGGEAG